MQKEEPHWSRYRIDNDVDDPTVFVFETKHSIIYEVRFKPSGYIFANEPDLEPFVYEMSLVLLENPTGRLPPSDSFVPLTIAHIFGLFFEQNERIVIYLCDTSDGRGHVRQRKFSTWFTHYNDSRYLQYSDSLTGKKGEVYYVSLIIRQNNPYRLRLTAAFRELMMENQKVD